jgi:hypothetical protein
MEGTLRNLALQLLRRKGENRDLTDESKLINVKDYFLKTLIHAFRECRRR